MKSTNVGVTRRQVIKSGLAAAVLPTIISATAEEPKPSEKIAIGVVGLGGRSFQLMNEIFKHKDARIVAVCDVDELHYRDRKWGEGTAYGRKPAVAKVNQHYGASKGVFVTEDFRELCSRDDIDAVVVATPDHWHALCTLEALRHGKDVYCEKPVTHTFAEGQAVVREVAKQKAIFQTGCQQRSWWEFQRTVHLARNGQLGKIKTIEVGLPIGYAKPMGDPKIVDPPRQLNYNFWLGPAPLKAYMRARNHRWWRGHRDYGGGVLMDFIGHHNDIAHWALNLDESGPNTVEAVDWTFPQTDVYNTPHEYTIACTYQGGVTSTISSRNKIGLKIIGDEGWVYVTRGKIEASNPEWVKTDYNPGKIRVDTSNDHMRDFLNGVKTRQPCIAPAKTAHRSITPGHLAYVSQQLGKPLKWNAAEEKVIGDEKANRLLLMNDYRQPWEI